MRIHSEVFHSDKMLFNIFPWKILQCHLYIHSMFLLFFIHSTISQIEDHVLQQEKETRALWPQRDQNAHHQPRKQPSRRSAYRWEKLNNQSARRNKEKEGERRARGRSYGAQRWQKEEDRGGRVEALMKNKQHGKPVWDLSHHTVAYWTQNNESFVQLP